MQWSSVKKLKLQTFVYKVKKSQNHLLKIENVHEEEINIIRNQYLYENLDNNEEVEVFSHEFIFSFAIWAWYRIMKWVCDAMWKHRMGSQNITVISTCCT